MKQLLKAKQLFKEKRLFETKHLLNSKQLLRKTVSAAGLILISCLFLCSCSQITGNSDNSITVTDSLDNKPVLVGNIPCSFPLVTEPTTINVLTSGHGDIQHNDVFVWQKYTEMTGVTTDFTTVTRDKRSEAVYSTLMNKNNNIDLIIRCKIPSGTLIQHGDNGLIIDLAQNGLLEKNAPNCWAYLQSHPEALASITNPDGTIYALPQVNSGPELRVARKLFINKNWLANVNMDVPTTTEEFYQLLKAFKEQDANGNGDPNDEIPFCSADWLSIKEAFFGAFGLGNRGLHNMEIDYDKDSGKVRLIAAADSYREFLEYFNKLYTEGLLEKNIFSINDEQWTSKATNDKIGVFASTNLAWLPADKIDNWIAVTEALAGPNGDKIWAAIRADFHSTGAAVIPATCQNPELVLRWLDYFWTDEGTLFYHMGIEGETFIVNDDGTYDYTPAIYEEMAAENKTFDNVVAQYSPYPGGSNPTVEIAPYFMGGEMAEVPAAAARELFKYGPDEYWPSFTFTSAENKTLETIRTDLQKYCDSACIDFIIGARPLSEWNDYLIQLADLNMAEMLNIYQAAVDRYYATVANK